MNRLATLWTLVLIALLAQPTPADTPKSPANLANESSADQALANELIGSWRIVSATFDGTPSKVHYGIVTIKHITPTQFTWLSYRPNERNIFRSMGGSWEVKDGKYLETPLYGMQKDFPNAILGKTTSIQCDIRDDIFTQTIRGPKGEKFIEVWQRIKPGEDPPIAVKPTDG